MLEVRYIYDMDNKPVNEYTISNGKYQLSAINVGAAITKIIVPNKNEKLENITLRYHDYKKYKDNKYFLGCLINYNKFINNEDCILNYYFNCELEDNSLIFTYENLDKYVRVKYSLLENILLIDYETNMDINLSNVIFFNLTGNIKGDVSKHELIINSEPFNIKSDIDYFEKIKANNENKILILKLKENGISFRINSNNKDIYLSLGKYFNKEFLINKKIEAYCYSGIGIVIGGSENNKYVSYSF